MQQKQLYSAVLYRKIGYRQCNRNSISILLCCTGNKSSMSRIQGGKMQFWDRRYLQAWEKASGGHILVEGSICDRSKKLYKDTCLYQQRIAAYKKRIFKYIVWKRKWLNIKIIKKVFLKMSIFPIDVENLSPSNLLRSPSFDDRMMEINLKWRRFLWETLILL